MGWIPIYSYTIWYVYLYFTFLYVILRLVVAGFHIPYKHVLQYQNKFQVYFKTNFVFNVFSFSPSRHLSVRPSVHHLVHSSVGVSPFVRASVPQSVHSFARASVRPFACSVDRLFVRTLHHPSIHLRIPDLKSQRYWMIILYKYFSGLWHYFHPDFKENST